MTTDEARIFSRHIPPTFAYRTPGQGLYLLNLMHHTHYNKGNNTKLFIFALCSIVYSDMMVALTHLSNLCTWFSRNTCNSCFEKGLFADFDISYQYSMVNFEYSDREVTLAEDANMDYRILEHDDATAAHYPASFYVHEHSFVTMRKKGSTLKFLVGVGADRIWYDTPNNQRYVILTHDKLIQFTTIDEYVKATINDATEEIEKAKTYLIEPSRVDISNELCYDPEKLGIPYADICRYGILDDRSRVIIRNLCRSVDFDHLEPSNVILNSFEYAPRAETRSRLMTYAITKMPAYHSRIQEMIDVANSVKYKVNVFVMSIVSS